MNTQEMLFVMRTKLKDLSVKVFNEPELLSSINSAIYDYVSKVPADSFPGLVKYSTFSGASWDVASDFLKILHVTIDHGVTPSGATTSTTVTEQCKVLDVDEEYYALHSPAWAGAWCKFYTDGSAAIVKCGPSCYSGTVTYIGIPSALASVSSTFPLEEQHEEPVLNYAIGMVLAKVSYEDSQRYLERYDMRVAAEQGTTYPQRKKVEKRDPQVLP